MKSKLFVDEIKDFLWTLIVKGGYGGHWYEAELPVVTCLFKIILSHGKMSALLSGGYGGHWYEADLAVVTCLFKIMLLHGKMSALLSGVLKSGKRHGSPRDIRNENAIALECHGRHRRSGHIRPMYFDLPCHEEVTPRDVNGLLPVSHRTTINTRSMGWAVV